MLALKNHLTTALLTSLGTPLCTARRTALDDTIAQLQACRIQINLDDTDLSGCNLSTFDLRGATAKGASFVHTTMAGTTLDGADFTGSTFFNVYISHTELRDTILKDTRWTRCAITDTNLIRTDLTGATMTQLIFANSDASHVKTSDPACLDVIDRLGSSRTVFFGGELSGTYSSAGGFKKGSTEEMVRAAETIRSKCEEAHISLAIGSDW